jgi:hypothetical protein
MKKFKQKHKYNRPTRSERRFVKMLEYVATTTFKQLIRTGLTPVEIEWWNVRDSICPHYAGACSCDNSQIPPYPTEQEIRQSRRKMNKR